MAEGPEYGLAPQVRDVFLELMRKLAIDPEYEAARDYCSIDPSRFAFVMCARPAPKYNGVVNIAKISCVGEPISLFTAGVRYIVAVHNGNNEWSTMSAEQRLKVLLHELLHVDEEFEFRAADWDKARKGKLVGHDINEHRKMIDMFGVDWYEKAAAKKEDVVAQTA